MEPSLELVEPASIHSRFAGRNDEALVRKWALVLNARYIICHIGHDDSGWQLLVPTELHSRSIEELQTFEAENRHWPPLVPPYRPSRESRLTTLSLLFLLATFHNITRLNIPLFGHSAPDWREIGSAKVHLINYGEWWRLVTALTLHADFVHLLSNLTIGGFFVFFLCRELGSGLGWSMLLCAGILGNWFNSLVQLPTHSSVGSSTAVFGAVGMLAVINFVRHSNGTGRRWRLVGAAALALLALLGTEGKNTDIGAHLFGFVSGVGIGFIAEAMIARVGRPGRIMNRLLAFSAGVIVLVSWYAAINLHL